MEKVVERKNGLSGGTQGWRREIFSDSRTSVDN